MEWDKEYYAVYNKENDEFMERTDWGDGEVDEDGYGSPESVVNFETQEDAESARKKYSNSDELSVVKVVVTFKIKECV